MKKAKSLDGLTGLTVALYPFPVKYFTYKR
jgi:hypothetical protein